MAADPEVGKFVTGLVEIKTKLHNNVAPLSKQSADLTRALVKLPIKDRPLHAAQIKKIHRDTLAQLIPLEDKVAALPCPPICEPTKSHFTAYVEAAKKEIEFSDHWLDMWCIENHPDKDPKFLETERQLVQLNTRRDNEMTLYQAAVQTLLSGRP